MSEIFRSKRVGFVSDDHRAPQVWPLVVGHDMAFWRQVALRINTWSQEQHIQCAQLTVVLPFVQLIAPLRYVWGQVFGDGFLPRIETTQTWGARIGGVHQAGAGPALDAVLDSIQAKPWLKRLVHEQAVVLADALVEPLVLMATDLVQAAGAFSPQEREGYWESAEEMAQHIPAGVAGVEAALGPLAVAWARATEGWASDVLFEAAEGSRENGDFHKSSDEGLQHRALGVSRKGLVIVQAGGEDALTKNLYQHWHASSRLWLDLDVFEGCLPTPLVKEPLPRQGCLFDDVHQVREGVEGEEGPADVGRDVWTDALPGVSPDPLSVISQVHAPQWLVARDAEDEAELAAAQVICLLNTGVSPVALCSQDRPIARRVWALLQRQKIALADETGWTLSTTRCAALVMGMVKAARLDATPDMVLDAFKNLPPDAMLGLDQLEMCLRRSGANQWPRVALPQLRGAAAQVLERINGILDGLQGGGQRTLWTHLGALDDALKSSKAWSVLLGDEAGREVLQTLHLHEMDDDQGQHGGYSDFVSHAQGLVMSYPDFVQWVNHTLENVTFIPPRPPRPQVVLTPLARVMLRPFAAVVIPGCDDSRLTAPPSLPGFWSEASRMALGLMSRTLWWQRLQAQWVQALRLPQVVLIWRSAEGAQPLGPATLVQRVLPGAVEMVDQREGQQQLPDPVWVPSPEPGGRFPVRLLSASAYKKLRECPYKFYAEHLLQLYKQDELDGELTRRDYGNWLHAVLRQFHLKRTRTYPEADAHEDRALLDEYAAVYAVDLDQAGLIPWQARWPKLRDAYLHWLKQHECGGAYFTKAEFAMQHVLAEGVTLQGRVDRLDVKQGVPVLLDYKTERRGATQARVRERYEEIQLPFYALLAQGRMTYEPDVVIDNAQQAEAAYLSLDDREDVVESYALEDLGELKSLLAKSIVHDMRRLRAGFAAYPLGQARACSYCHVNGLCRKGYWTEVVNEPVGGEEM